jgi:outer membrane receptor protein involved in Fe transport
VATYLNLGPLRNRGLELSLEHRFSNALSAFANSSWQATPKVLDPDPAQIRYQVNEVGLPPKTRINAGVSYDGRRALGNLNVAYAGEAFWIDVLNEPYWGRTKAYTLLNATAGVKLAEGRLVLSLRGTNLLDQKVLQHIYGDLIRRSVIAEVRLQTH